MTHDMIKGIIGKKYLFFFHTHFINQKHYNYYDNCY